MTNIQYFPSAAHRDGSPYLLRTSHLSDPKEVGRTVPVSRLFVWFAPFDAKKVTSQFIPGAPGGGLADNFKFLPTEYTENTEKCRFPLRLTEIRQLPDPTCFARAICLIRRRANRPGEPLIRVVRVIRMLRSYLFVYSRSSGCGVSLT